VAICIGSRQNFDLRAVDKVGLTSGLIPRSNDRRWRLTLLIGLGFASSQPADYGWRSAAMISGGQRQPDFCMQFFDLLLVNLGGLPAAALEHTGCALQEKHRFQ